MNEAPTPENEAGTAALAASEARFRVLSESSPSGVFHCNARGECTYTNGRCQRMFGLESQDFRGEEWLKRIHPEDLSRVYQGWRECATLWNGIRRGVSCSATPAGFSASSAPAPVL